jgi:hypothetical protein
MPGQAVARKRAVSRQKLEEAVVGREAIVAENAQKLRGRGPDDLQEDRTETGCQSAASLTQFFPAAFAA